MFFITVGQVFSESARTGFGGRIGKETVVAALMFESLFAPDFGKDPSRSLCTPSTVGPTGCSVEMTARGDSERSAVDVRTSCVVERVAMEDATDAVDELPTLSVRSGG